MTGKEHGSGEAPSSRRGLRFDDLAGEERVRVLADAFDYRGDVTLDLDDGTRVEGYLFALEARATEPHVKLLPPDPSAARLTVPLARIVGCEFSGRDTADGRSWEAWVKRYEQKRARLAMGLPVDDIEPKPEV